MRVVKRVDIMDTRVPELDQYTSAPPASVGDVQSSRDDESRAQQAALEQLADRISAARSIV
jgi:hypothetical protein